MKASFNSENINRIINNVVKDEVLVNAMSYLCEDEKFGFITVLLGCAVRVEDFPKIADNDIAKDIEILSFNPVKNEVELKYTSLATKKWDDRTSDRIVTVREEPKVQKKTITYEDYFRNYEKFDLY